MAHSVVMYIEQFRFWMSGAKQLLATNPSWCYLHKPCEEGPGPEGENVFQLQNKQLLGRLPDFNQKIYILQVWAGLQQTYAWLPLCTRSTINTFNQYSTHA